MTSAPLMTRHRFSLVFLSVLCAASGARAQTSDEIRAAQLENLRAQSASEIHLRAYDLLDELVYQWSRDPPFASPTPLILADVQAPVGFNSGMEALIENHLVNLLLNNKAANVTLIHCPACTEMTAHSSKAGTVISRGIDQPDVLKKLGAISDDAHALFLDIEAEGSSLVLRVRICTLKSNLPIVYAKTLSSATSHAPLLRDSTRLVSAADARKEYVETLEGRGRLLIPVRLSLSQFAGKPDATSISSFPLIFVSTGVEMSISQTRAWVGSVTVGAGWIPQLQTTGLLQARIGRLLTGSSTSLTHPDVYGYLGLSLTGVAGPSALILNNDTINVSEVLAVATGVTVPLAFFPAAQLGFEGRVNNRVGAGVWVETTPTLNNSQSIGRWLDYGFLQIHSIGCEVTLWF